MPNFFPPTSILFILISLTYCKPSGNKKPNNQTTGPNQSADTLPVSAAPPETSSEIPPVITPPSETTPPAADADRTSIPVLFNSVSITSTYPDGTWVFEVEKAPIKSGKLELYQDDNGTQGLKITESSSDNSKAYIKIDFSVDEASGIKEESFIYIRGLAKNLESDSIRFSLNNGSPLDWNFFPTSQDYIIMRANNCGGSNCPLADAFRLKQGNNFMEIRDREAGIKLDAIIISDHPNLDADSLLVTNESLLSIDLSEAGQLESGNILLTFTAEIKDDVYKLTKPRLINHSDISFDFQIKHILINGKGSELYNAFDSLEKKNMGKGEYVLEEAGLEKTLTIIKANGANNDNIAIVYSLKESAEIIGP